MVAVSVLAIVIFGAIGLGVLVGITLLLASVLQGDSDRRRIEKARRARDRRDPD